MATIDGENAKNVRQAIQVQIQLPLPNSTSLKIYNEQLISCTVSLRSDLSRFNPTLPESEIEIEAYWSTDISTLVSQIPESTRLVYRAGYTGDWGPYRYFYTDEQVTWNNNILHIHAVDQVHKLDGELPPIFLGQVWDGGKSISDGNVLNGLYQAFCDLICGSADGWSLHDPVDVSHWDNETFEEGTWSSVPSGGALNSLIPRGTRREMVAKMMNLCHFEFSAGVVNNKTNFWPTYVDAGHPSIYATHPASPTRTIYERDCADVQIAKERVINSLTVLTNEIQATGAEEKRCPNVSATLFKQSGIAITYGDLIGRANLGLSDDIVNPNDDSMYYYWIWQRKNDIQKRSRPYSDSITYNNAWLKANKYGIWLLDDQVETHEWNPGGYSFIDLSGSKWTQPMTDTGPETPESEWNYMISVDWINANAESCELDNRGFYFITTDEKSLTRSRVTDGMAVSLTDEIFWTGHAKVKHYSGGGNSTVLPNLAASNIMNRSNITGSFKWKGDPRMQPRDIVNFVRLDNTTEVITLENITLIHEGGGMTAEITYRKGIV